MLRIRLTRRGKKNQAFFRLVVAEARRPIKGKFIENLGFFNPHTKETKLVKERISYWLGVGAQPSVTVHNLLVKNGLIKGKKIKNIGLRKVKNEEAPSKAKAQAPAAEVGSKDKDQDEKVTEPSKAKPSETAPEAKTEKKAAKTA